MVLKVLWFGLYYPPKKQFCQNLYLCMMNYDNFTLPVSSKIWGLPGRVITFSRILLVLVWEVVKSTLHLYRPPSASDTFLIFREAGLSWVSKLTRFLPITLIILGFLKSLRTFKSFINFYFLNLYSYTLWCWLFQIL